MGCHGCDYYATAGSDTQLPQCNRDGFPLAEPWMIEEGCRFKTICGIEVDNN